MAYSTAQTVANVIATVQTANPAIGVDAINNMCSGLASGFTVPLGTPVLFGGVLIKCTTGFAAGGQLFSTDASPA